MNFFKLNNPIKNYAWGSETALQELFGVKNPNQEPQAEIWMGAHPNGCSKIQLEGEEFLLSEFIAKDKAQILSTSTEQEFGTLPYLFKVLSAGNALSIQVHPNKLEAEQGFAKEEELGLELSAPNRNYKDANHKPELVYALTPYQAMNGFRAYTEIVLLFSKVIEESNVPAIHQLLEVFKKNLTATGLEVFFIGILSLKGEAKEASIQGLIEYAKAHQQPSIENDLGTLIMELNKSYPGDIGLFAPLMLNVLTLSPGEAMFLDARTPHAYLKGTGLEVMANSDNVLRAGLTPKHIDLSELARCTLFEQKTLGSLLLPPLVVGNKYSYLVPVSDFSFDCYMDAYNEKITVRSAEILFVIDSGATISHRTGETLYLDKGESVFIPAYAEEYILESVGRVARVYN
ncbi:mannose-6-phosphate isomerase, class I [Vibrio parahaemolyticus]|uniref:mannose-6-phosphate isomerase, class I n=1 Tax=Vibrio parahaemolyticus TaxID=670 RepID=UPI0009A61C14|nr:mannose-6-phosphate isomerase, class I [Vibrio parahaemolyticus]MCS0033912.1 mannose-6-phosphate isomerase, class I [Vibrio parahaemolyticus]MDN4705124.1 mannose-6-phosphate isomerase, class I [Vibrio parahaemolyticus]MDN4713075.1 mannose-6-phosphate isomerase, class I [Vibrio parahaemolyticus]MDN4717007.1 mannose-6-phosphate isomerase, class I [Vibrio parahaemolyticus]MDN4724431.1 mannose-6-phosphate isomerase, class I [Vibrio parahaemolyticus]